MPNYRVCLIRNDRIVEEYYFHCETDEFALSEAQGALGEHSRVEVWRGTRRVGVEVLEIPAAKPDNDGVEFFPETATGLPNQSIEARRLLGWSQLRLALAADVSPFAVELFEAGSATTTPQVILAIQAALEAAGVEFIPENEGGVRVRLRKQSDD
jgi:hypothetical protein